MKVEPRTLILPTLAFALLALILGILSCGEDPEKESLRDQVKTTQAMLDEVRDSLAMEQKRTQDERERAKEERQAREAAENDLLIAAVIAFSCVIGIFLLIGLLLHERRSRRALVSFLRRIRGRSADGEAG
jgi:hypothetical protein